MKTKKKLTNCLEIRSQLSPTVFTVISESGADDSASMALISPSALYFSKRSLLFSETTPIKRFFFSVRFQLFTPPLDTSGLSLILTVSSLSGGVYVYQENSKKARSTYVERSIRSFPLDQTYLHAPIDKVRRAYPFVCRVEWYRRSSQLLLPLHQILDHGLLSMKGAE